MKAQNVSHNTILESFWSIPTLKKLVNLPVITLIHLTLEQGNIFSPHSDWNAIFVSDLNAVSSWQLVRPEQT